MRVIALIQNGVKKSNNPRPPVPPAPPGEDYSPDPYDWNFLGKNLFCMAAEGFVYFLFNILLQYRFFLDHWYIRTQVMCRKQDALYCYLIFVFFNSMTQST